MFLLSTSITIVTIPWIYDKKDRDGIHIEPIKPNTLLEKFASKFILPLLFIGWLYLLNRFVQLPIIEWYIQLIWGLYIFGIIILYVFEEIKKFQENKKSKIK